MLFYSVARIWVFLKVMLRQFSAETSYAGYILAIYDKFAVLNEVYTLPHLLSILA